MNDNINNSWISLILIALATFVVTLDTTFMNVSISQLIVDLNTNLSTIQMIMSFYTLITASLMLICAKLQDIIGKKNIFLFGALTYGLGALIASVSFNSTVLFLGWSLLEGIGGALMIPATISIIMGTYEKDDRTFALAIVSAISGIAAAIGPIFGGVVTTFLSWRFGFIIELLAIVIIFIFSSKIKNFKPIMDKNNFDLVGSILLVLGLLTFIIGMLQLKVNADISVILVIVSTIILIGFVFYEKIRKSNDEIPLVDIDLFKDYNLRVGTIIRLLIMLSMTGTIFAISVFLQNVLEYNAFNTGINLIPTTGGILVAALISSRLIKRFDHKSLMILGFIFAIISMFMLKYQFNINTTFWSIAPGMFILGIGLGLVISLGIDISIINIDRTNHSTASGILTTSQTLGNSIGIAIIGCILIMGAVNGLNYSIDEYNLDVNDSELAVGSGHYLEKLGHIDYDDLEEHQLKKDIVNNVFIGSMKMVMNVTTILLLLGLLLTLTLKDKKIRKI